MGIKQIKEQAAASATEILEEHGFHDVPVDVHALANELGVAVVAEALDDDTSGVVVIKNDRAVIGVNKYHHPHRQRFTIAHELGHYFLHKDGARVFVDKTYAFYRDRDSTEGTKEQEIAANAFAAELLMPEHLIKEYWERHDFDLFDEVAVRRLALKFEVSEQALTIRLMNLGLLANELLF